MKHITDLKAKLLAHYKAAVEEEHCNLVQECFKGVYFSKYDSALITFSRLIAVKRQLDLIALIESPEQYDSFCEAPMDYLLQRAEESYFEENYEVTIPKFSSEDYLQVLFGLYREL